MRNVVLVVLAFASVVSFSACATILSGKTQKINVTTSTGEKIKGTIDGVPFDAPGIVDVRRHNQDKILITNDPKCNQTTIAPKTVDPVFFINILSGGAFGSTTDYVSEAMWKYQDTVSISCRN